MENNRQLHTDNKLLLKLLSIVSGGFAFFAIAFYYKVDEGLKKVEEGIIEQSRTNTILSVAISQISEIKEDVTVVKKDLKKVEVDVNRLQVRVGHLEDIK